MRRASAWIAGALGIAALLRFRRRHRPDEPPALEFGADPAVELRRKLQEARAAGDDRDEFAAAEGTPIDEVEAPRSSLEERRAAIHARAQEALGEMDSPNEP
ncbi:MAG: hypothetical protein MSC30_08700 [Gaiellaceae bacterium MAG52_C11]|nr:hypothetical protein [Candidatus Gaiellasilicea maunaloa]